MGIGNREKKILAAALLAASALAVALLSACQTSTAAENEAVLAQEPAAAQHSVRVAEAVEGDVKVLITRVTTISAPDTVAVLPRIGGQITELKVEEGQRVSAGHVIARLDDLQLRLSEARAKALMEKARTDHDLAARKLAHEIIGEQEYLEYKHAYDQAERDYNAAVVEREKTEIRAPIAGIVSHRHVSLGDTVFASTPIVTITDPAKLQAEILVPQDQVEQVAVGNEVVLNPGGDISRVIAGVVERISPVVETVSGTVKVVVNVPAGQRGVLPGQFVKAHIVTGVREGVTLVPRDAVVIENAMSVIYKVVDGFARRVPVQMGFANGDMVEVIGEVAPGDSVVVAGKNGINDMTRVRIADAF